VQLHDLPWKKKESAFAYWEAEGKGEDEKNV